MNRRAMLHQMQSLQVQLEQALLRAEAAEQEVRMCEADNALLRRERDAMRGRNSGEEYPSPATRKLIALPPEWPAKPVAEEASYG